MAGDQDIRMRSPSAQRPPALDESDAVEVSAGPGLLDLPPEVVVQVFYQLGMTDRLCLLRVCKSLQEVYNEASILQYEFALRTSAYLDVAFEHAQIEEEDEENSVEPLTVGGGWDEPDTERGRGRTSSRLGGSSTHPSVTFPLPFDPPLSERVYRPSNRPLGAAEKAAQLIEREKRWSKLTEVDERRFHVKGPAVVYELQEGLFLMCDEYKDSADGKPDTIRLVPLPSAMDLDLDNPPIPLKSAKLPFSIADLTMDPTQDLIVVSEHRPASSDPTTPGPTHRYHLLTLSTFAPHPLAAFSELDFPPYLHPIMSTRQLLQVMGDVLVVMVSRYMASWLLAGLGMNMPMASHGNEEEIVCWNWKTGNVLARLSLPENPWLASFALLTPTSFMITSTSNISTVLDPEPRPAPPTVFPPVVQIYSFQPDPYHAVNPAQPLLAEFHDDSTPRPVLLAQLELPRFAAGAVVDGFDIRPDPAFPPREPGPGGESSGPRIGGSKPFTQDPGKGVVVLDLQLIEPAEGGEGGTGEKVSYELFVLRETLVDLAKAGEERLRAARDEGGTDGFERFRVEEDIKWEDWATEGARMMDASMPTRSWVCSCSGYRFISLIPSDDLFLAPPGEPDAPRRSDLLLMDFSPYSVRREIGLSKTALAPWDKLQDIPTSSAPAPLSDEDIRVLLQEMQQWDKALDDETADPTRREQELERTFERFRKQYDKMFHAASDRADRHRSDRADRERGRGRAGGRRSDSASQSRSRSRSQHHLSGRHHRPPNASHSHSRTRYFSPSPGPPMPSASGSGMPERRSRSRTPRSVSPSAIFRRASQPINMAGPDQEMLDDNGDIEEEEEVDEDYEVRVVTAPTVLERRRLWREDVVSGLPFREVWRRKEMRANGVMIDDQRVIVVCTEGKRQGDWSRVQQTMTVLCM